MQNKTGTPVGIPVLFWRKGRDSNPRSVISRTHDFQSCALDQLSHLCMVLRYYITSAGGLQEFFRNFFIFFVSTNKNPPCRVNEKLETLLVARLVSSPFHRAPNVRVAGQKSGRREVCIPGQEVRTPFVSCGFTYSSITCKAGRVPFCRLRQKGGTPQISCRSRWR